MQRLFSGGYNASEYYGAATAGVSSANHSDTQLARAYIKNQQYSKVYDPVKALYAGTAFADLDMPYTVKLK